MGQDFSCDYLVDITGLVDNGENHYSCCHPSGVMCGKEDCPVVIDFMRRCQKDTAANDYDDLTRGNLCPLKERGPIAQTDMRALMDMANGCPPLIARKPPLCNGSRCAWWDAEKERCAVLSIARNK